MRNVSTIQLLPSKYLMWPSRLSAQCRPAFLSLPAAGDRGNCTGESNRRPRPCVRACVAHRVMQVSTVCANDCTCAAKECACTLSRVLLCSWFLSFTASAMTSRGSGRLPTAGGTGSPPQIGGFLLLAIRPSLSPCPQQYPSPIVSLGADLLLGVHL